MAQKVNPIAVRLNFNRFSDSSWFSDYYYSTLLYQDLNFRQYLSSIKQPNANKLGLRAAKCIIHHFPKRSLIHLFCLSDPRKKDPLPPVPRAFGPGGNPIASDPRATVTAIPAAIGPTSASEDRVMREDRLLTSSDVVSRIRESGFAQSQAIQLSAGPGERSEVARIGGGPTIPNAARSKIQQEKLIVGNHGALAQSDYRRVMDTSENVLIRTRAYAHSLRAFWLKSSQVQKKRALVNLHRGIVESFSQVCSAKQREQRLVFHSSRESNASDCKQTFGAWYRKTRAKMLGPIITSQGRYQAAMLQAFFEPEAESFELWGASSVPELTDLQDTLWPGLSRSWQVLNGQQRKASDASNILTDLPASGGEPTGERERCQGHAPFGEVDLRLRRRDNGLIDRELILLKLRHDALRSVRIFNFYALHYYFMHKMGDSLARLPLRPFRASDCKQRGTLPPESSTPGYPGGMQAPDGSFGEASDASNILTDLTASGALAPGERSARIRRRAAKATAKAPALVGFPIASSTLWRLRPSLRTFGEIRQDRPKDVYPAFQVEGAPARKRVDSQSWRTLVNPNYPSSLSCATLRDPDGYFLEHESSFFGSSSCNHITKSLDFYLSNVHSILSQNTNTFISLRPIKVHSVFQCASLVAQEVACKLEQKKSFRLICRLIFQQLAVCNYIKGIRITCSGRLNGAEIAKTECRKFGETSLHVFSDKIDYARAEASTPYGILGVKVWISYI